MAFEGQQSRWCERNCVRKGIYKTQQTKSKANLSTSIGEGPTHL